MEGREEGELWKKERKRRQMKIGRREEEEWVKEGEMEGMMGDERDE